MIPRYLQNPYGGLARQAGVTAADVDPYELELGIETEMEHTDDPDLAEQIALDHLTEHPNYYSVLLAAMPEA